MSNKKSESNSSSKFTFDSINGLAGLKSSGGTISEKSFQGMVQLQQGAKPSTPSQPVTTQSHQSDQSKNKS